MRSTLSVLVGFPLFIFFIFTPMREKLLISTAVMMPTNNRSTLELLNYANQFDPCDVKLLITMGDMAALQNNLMFSIMCYGKAMICAPSNSMARIKYGEALILAGFNGVFAVQEAKKLEPHNPVYDAEVRRVTTLQLPLQ